MNSKPCLWRGFRPGDEPELRAAHAAQCAGLGMQFAFPDLEDPRTLLVAVCERAGKVVGAVVAHATVEVMFVGGDGNMVRSAVRQESVLAEWLRALGADEAHAFVPRRWVRSMQPILRRLGFAR
ncbi:MAG TPA: hypothetical protein VIC32_05535, partial [Terriglobales bacterium]